MASVLNNQVREEIKESGRFQYEIADMLGVSEGTLIKWLRKPLDEKKKSRILEVIETAKTKKENYNEQ